MDMVACAFLFCKLAARPHIFRILQKAVLLRC